MKSNQQNTERRFTMPGSGKSGPFDLTTREGLKLVSSILSPLGDPAIPLATAIIELASKLLTGNRVPTESQVEAAEKLIRTGKEMGVSKFRFHVSRDAGLSLSKGKLGDVPPIKVVAGTSETMTLEVEYK